MLSGRSLVLPLGAFALLVCGSASASAELRVVVAYAEPELASAAERLQAELRSAGRRAVTVEQNAAVGSCASRAPLEPGEDQVDVLLQPAGEGAVIAEVCALRTSERVTAVTVRGELDEEAEFAIVVTEAVHGLLLAADKQEAPEGERPAADAAAAKSAPPRGVELSLGSRLALDVPTGKFWLGVVPGVHVPLTKHLSLGAEVFVGFLPIEYADAEMTLESQLIWARVGLLGSSEVGQFVLGWHLSAGPYGNRASAVAVPPRTGGSDGAFGAIIAAGGRAQFPARGRFYVESTLGLSTLVPRVAYQMSAEVTPELGQLLFEGGLGVGLRLAK